MVRFGSSGSRWSGSDWKHIQSVGCCSSIVVQLRSTTSMSLETDPPHPDQEQLDARDEPGVAHTGVMIGRNQYLLPPHRARSRRPGAPGVQRSWPAPCRSRRQRPRVRSGAGSSASPHLASSAGHRSASPVWRYSERSDRSSQTNSASPGPERRTLSGKTRATSPSNSKGRTGPTARSKGHPSQCLSSKMLYTDVVRTIRFCHSPGLEQVKAPFT